MYVWSRSIYLGLGVRTYLNPTCSQSLSLIPDSLSETCTFRDPHVPVFFTVAEPEGWGLGRSVRVSIESIEWFTEGQTFSRSYDFGSSSTTSSPSPDSKLDHRQSGRLRKGDKLLTGEGGGGGGRITRSQERLVLHISVNTFWVHVPQYLMDLWRAGADLWSLHPDRCRSDHLRQHGDRNARALSSYSYVRMCFLPFFPNTFLLICTLLHFICIFYKIVSTSILEDSFEPNNYNNRVYLYLI